MIKHVMKGDIFFADLDPVIGSEQGGIRPVLVLQNNIGNAYSNTIIIAPLTSKNNIKADLPTHIKMTKIKKIPQDSILLLEQIRTIDKCRINNYVGRINPDLLWSINKAIITSFGISISKIDFQKSNV